MVADDDVGLLLVNVLSALHVEGDAQDLVDWLHQVR